MKKARPDTSQPKVRISSRQLSCITAGFTLGSSLIFTGGLRYGARDTWISEAISTVLGLLIIWMLSLLLKKFPGKNLLEILTALTGPFLGRLFLLCYIWYSLLIAALVIYTIQSLSTTAVLPETPGWVFCLTLVFSIGYIIRKGLEPTARCAELYMPVVFPVLTVLFLAAWFEVDPSYLQPLFAAGWAGFFKSLLVVTAFPDAELFILAGIAVYVRDSAKILSGFCIGYLLAAAFLIVRPLLSVGIFSVPEAEQVIFPTYMLARIIHFGNFVERIEIFLLFTWFFIVFIKAAACVFVSVDNLAQLLKAQDFRPFVYPFCVLLVPLSLIAYGGFQEVPEFLSQVLPVLSFPVSFIALPLLLLISRRR